MVFNEDKSPGPDDLHLQGLKANVLSGCPGSNSQNSMGVGGYRIGLFRLGTSSCRR